MSDTAVTLTTKKDWASDQEVRWCPGCGDYGILQALGPAFDKLVNEHLFNIVEDLPELFQTGLDLRCLLLPCLLHRAELVLQHFCFTALPPLFLF